jgi:hypothetical protein
MLPDSARNPSVGIELITRLVAKLSPTLVIRLLDKPILGATTKEFKCIS